MRSGLRMSLVWHGMVWGMAFYGGVFLLEDKGRSPVEKLPWQAKVQHVMGKGPLR